MSQRIDGKIAVFISGPVRYVTLVNQRLETVLKDCEYDCFYHLWTEDLGNKIRVGADCDYRELDEHPRTKIVIVQSPYSEDSFADTIGTETGSNSTINATMGMFVSVSLLCNYLKQLPDFEDYKYVLRLRTDCAILNDDFVSSLDPDTNVLTISKSYFIPDDLLCDHICFGSVENFFKLWCYRGMDEIYQAYKTGDRNPELTLLRRYQRNLNDVPLNPSIIRFRDYHIVYYPPRDCEPKCITGALNNVDMKDFFLNASQYVDLAEIDEFNARWKEEWKRQNSQQQDEKPDSVCQDRGNAGLSRTRMEDEPEFSFVMIVLNGMPFIEYSLRSVYDFAHEIIIVEGAVENCMFAANPDGSSRDGTVEFIKSFPDPANKVRLIQGKWPDKCAMQNEALKDVTGNYVWLVDSDEVYKKEDLEKIKRILTRDSSITHVNFIPDNFWKGLDYIFVSPGLFEPVCHYRRLFKFVPGAVFTSHRPPTMVWPDAEENTEQMHLLGGQETRSMGIIPFHYSYVLEEQVKQKIHLYRKYGWDKDWEVDLLEWYNECFLKWTPQNREVIEARYPVWTGDKSSRTQRFDGKHPEVMEDFRKGLTPREYSPAVETVKQAGAIEHSPAESEHLRRLLRRPQYLKIETTNVCNADCAFCVYRFMKRRKGVMSMELFGKVVRDYVDAGGGALAMSPLVGDCLVDTKFLERLRYCRNFNQITRIGFHTNMIGLNEWTDEQVLEILELIDTWNCSIGPNRDVYRDMFGVDQFERVITNLERLHSLISRSEHKPLVQLNGRAAAGDFKQDERLRSLSLALTCKEVTWMTAYMDWGGLLPNLPRNTKVIKTTGYANKQSPCMKTLIASVVFCDGRVGACACADFDAMLIIGDVNKQKLGDILGGKQRCELLKSFGKPWLNEYCQKCSFYQPVDFKWIARQITGTNPHHSDPVRPSRQRGINSSANAKPTRTHAFLPVIEVEAETGNLQKDQIVEEQTLEQVGDRPETKSPFESAGPKSKRVRVAEDYVEAGIKVDSESSFGSRIQELFLKIRPRKIIETGTYLGTGTTTIIAHSLKAVGIDDAVFYTIEVNPENYAHAKRYFEMNNVKVHALNGLSVPRSKLPTREQIERKTITDVDYDGIFVDHGQQQRVELYYNETDFSQVPDNLLYECLKNFDFKPDFVLLDSGGHVGNTEFNYLIDNLRGECYIALDDIYHVKHHCSFKQIQEDDRFELIFHSGEKFGFCITKFTPRRTAGETVGGESAMPAAAPAPARDASKPGKRNLAGLSVAEFEEFLKAKVGTPENHADVLEVLELLTPDKHLLGDMRWFRENSAQSTDLRSPLPFLNAVAKHFKIDNYLEIGVRRGRSFAQVLRYNPEANACAFDLWIEDYAGTPNPGPKFVQAEMEKVGYRRNIHFYSGDSHALLPGFFQSPGTPDYFDLIYVDGDHSYEGALRDLHDVIGRLKPGGILLFDDACHPQHRYLAEVWDRIKTGNPHLKYYEFTGGNGVCIGLNKGSRCSDGRLYTQRGSCADAAASANANAVTEVLGRGEVVQVGPSEYPSTSEKSKVLIVRPDAVGDFVIFSGVLCYFRKLYSDAHISILVQKNVEQLAETCPYIDEVIAFDRKSAEASRNCLDSLVQELRARKFDIAINPVYSRTELDDSIALNADARQTIAFIGDDTNMAMGKKLLNDACYDNLVPATVGPLIETKRNEEFIEGLGVSMDGPCLPTVWLKQEDRIYTDGLLNELGVREPIVVCPFAQAKGRQWPIHKWAELLSLYQQYPVLICGTDNDRTEAGLLIELSEHPNVHNICGRTNLRQLAALFSQSRLCLASESGPAHIAAAVSCPQVVIIGGGHFRRFMPYSPTTNLVYLPMDCYNCNWKCKYWDWEIYCITQVRVGTVDRAVREVLASPNPPAGEPRFFKEHLKMGPCVVSAPPELRLPEPQLNKVTTELEEPVPRRRCGGRLGGLVHPLYGQCEDCATPALKKNPNQEHGRELHTPHGYLVTAIVSTYNSEEFIGSCLQDLENQTIADRLEIIVVNSGSQQNEEAIVKEFQQKYQNIKYIRTENRETIYKAWNRAIRMASGKYVTNANTDDTHREGALEILAAALERNPDAALAYADQGKVEQPHGQVVGEFVAGEFSRYRMLAGWCFISSHPMWRKKVHDEFGYFDQTFVAAGDWEFWLRISQKYDFVYVNQNLGNRLWASDCLSRRESERKGGIVTIEAQIVRKCYNYALETGIFVDCRGISASPVFSDWPEVNLWRRRVQAKLGGWDFNPQECIERIHDLRIERAPKLSIVIVSNNNFSALQANLSSLSQQTEDDFEVIVVNSGQTIPEPGWIAERIRCGFCCVEMKQDFGPSFARNVGIEQARGAYIVFVDDDVVADKNLVRNTLVHFGNAKVSGIRGRILPKAGAKHAYWPPEFDLGQETIWSACETGIPCAFRKELLDRVGGFNENLFGYEPEELSYRVYRANDQKIDSVLYFPDVVVCRSHPVGPLSYYVSRLKRRIGRWTAMRMWPNIERYLEFVRDLYPHRQKDVEKDHTRLLNRVLFLQKHRPWEAVKWAQKAVTSNPDRIDCCFTLGSLYLELEQYNQAEVVLERILIPLTRALSSADSASSHLEAQDTAAIAGCLVSTCTKLAQCYMKQRKFDKIRQIYTNLLNMPQVTIAEQQKAQIRALLAKLDTTSPREAAICENTDAPETIKSRDGCLVSAIVSTYNCEQFLNGCLDDLEQQTIADRLEIIVVDSGSQQNEEAIVRQYQQNYNNIVYIKTKQREGIYSAWNRAVKVARGKFVTNANTDDRHRPDALEIMAKKLQANPDIALVYADQIRTDTPNDTFANQHGTEMLRRPDYSRERLLLGCCVGSQPMWRKSLHDVFGYFDETLDCAGDWDFWIRISGKYDFRHIPQFLGLYYYNQHGIEHARKIHSLYERYIVGRRYGTEYIAVIPYCKPKPSDSLVSVVMPVYNGADYIGQAIESVLIQSYPRFELIIVDDGSTDATRDVVAGFKDERIKYIYKENGGPSSARNLAIKEATGQYIMPLDSDDMMTPDSIVKHLQEFQRHPDVDLIYCDVLLIDSAGKPIKVMEKPEYQDRRYMVRDLLQAGHPIIPFRLGIRKSVFDKIGLYDESLIVAEDYDMIRRFVKAGLNARHLPEPLHLRRMHPQSLCRSTNYDKIRNHFDVIHRFTETFAPDELFPEVEWDKIPPEMRQLHAKSRAALIFLEIGKLYLRSDAMVYAQTAFARACSQLKECLSIDPGNHRLQQMLGKCELIRAKYENSIQNAACWPVQRPPRAIKAQGNPICQVSNELNSQVQGGL